MPTKFEFYAISRQILASDSNLVGILKTKGLINLALTDSDKWNKQLL